MSVRLLLVVFLAACVSAGCTSTVVTGSWKNPDFIGKVNKAYVIGVARQDTSRFLFEDEFSKQLRAAGAEGVVSYRDFPDKTSINKDVVKKAAKSRNADAVLVTRVIGQRMEQVVTPGRTEYRPAPYYQSYGRYYSRSYEAIHTPARVTNYEVFTIEANIYDTDTEKLIWSAQMETVFDQNLNKVIVDFVEQVVKDMDEKGLI